MKLRKTAVLVVALAVIFGLGLGVAGPVQAKKLMLKTQSIYPLALPVIGDTMVWFAEQIEKASGGDVDVDIDLENQSVTVKDENGGEMAVQGGKNVDLKTFSSMGYDIALPPGVIDGEVTMFKDDDGEVSGVTGRFQTDGSLDRKQILQALDQSLTKAGLTFTDPFDESVTKVDLSNPQQGQQFHYKDDKGIQFFIVSTGDNEFVISGFKE